MNILPAGCDRMGGARDPHRKGNFISMRRIFAMLAAGLFCGAAVAQRAAEPLPYVMTNSITLPSSDTGWDYIHFQPGSPRLFMARLKDGLTVFDADRGRVVTTLPNSIGANGPVLLPHHDRGYVAMSDGTMLSFALKTLKVIDRIKLAEDGGLNSGTFDPATGKLLGKTRFPFRKMDDPTADGKGHLYAPARKDGIVLKLDSQSLTEQARWDVGCDVSKIRYLPAAARLLGACVGDRPALFILDPEAGKVTARITIGNGLDALAIDEKRHRIVTSNDEGSMTVIRYDGRDSLELVATVRTHFGARMMDIDHRTGRLYLVNADSTDFPGKDGENVSRYHPDSFRVETWQPQ
jgi:hypothetical protein